MTNGEGSGGLKPIPRAEFIALVAALMALNALAIDTMLPALGQMGRDTGAPGQNAQQQIIIVYLFGLGLPQLVFGPLTDRFGRRGPLAVALVGYGVTSLACALTRDFEALLVWRFLQGVAASGIRVCAVAVVRDQFAGRQMASTMSLIMTVFMIVPIIAPTIGQGILLFAPWPWIFALLGLAGAGTLIWVLTRLRESLPVERRRALSVASVWQAYRKVFVTPVTLGYMLASGVVFSALFAFIAAAPQILGEVYGLSGSFPVWFAGIAVMMAAANFTNSRLVGRFGMRLISHCALVTFTGLGALVLVLQGLGLSQFAVFYPLFVVIFACFGLMGSNFNALAMEPLGEIAGTASAVYGFFTTTLSALLGGFIASRFDGTAAPLMQGYVAIGLVTLAILLVVEKGRLFRSR